MNVVAVSNKLFMSSLILLMIVFIFHRFGWKRPLLWRKLTDRSEREQDADAVQGEAGDTRRDGQAEKPFAMLRNPLLWIALAGIAVSIVLTL